MTKIKLEGVIPNIEFTQADIEEFITQHLPDWKKACNHKDAGNIIVHQGAFGNTMAESILMALAVKYAGIKGKEVHIVYKK